jgi:site-specific DNA-cytosine methylase
MKVKCYVYVNNNDTVRQVAKRHSKILKERFPALLPIGAILSSFSTLAGDISLLFDEDIHWIGHVDLLIIGWPCQGMSMAGKQNGLQDGRSSRFFDMVRVIRYL